MIALVGVILVAVALVLDAWFSPPLLPISTPILGFVAAALMQLAKQTREADGAEIPEVVVKNGASIANTEALLSLVCGLLVCVTFVMAHMEMLKQYQQAATVATLSFFGLTSLLFRITRARFDALMKAASLEHAAR